MACIFFLNTIIGKRFGIEFGESLNKSVEVKKHHSMLKEFNISTKDRYELIDITERVEKIVQESDIKNGLVLIFVMHSTAGILLNENESGLKEDWLKIFKKITSGVDFIHNQIDNNADAHIIAGLIGNEKILVLKDRKLARGTWQQIFLVELDGPRTRKVIIKIFQG